MDFYKANSRKPPKYSKYISSESRSDASKNRSGRRTRDWGSKGQMHDAVCAECGNSCQIPFQPRQGRPVLCSDCFRKTKPSSDRYSRDDRRPSGDRYSRDDRRPSGDRYSRDDRYTRGRDSESQMYDAVCAECGNSCQIPFQPRQGRPVLCSDCFRNSKPRDNYSRDDRRPRGDRFSRGNRRGGRDTPRGDRRERKESKKQRSFLEGGSDTFYTNLREKLFEVLGGKKCTSCGFADERALGISEINDKEAFDSVSRGEAISSWGKYISNPDLARKQLQVLCLNCNQTK